MFSGRKAAAKVVATGDGYDDEQHLVAAVSEFKKVESVNQSMVDQLYQRLASPFRITSKPCESNRAAVLQCYQQLQTTTKSSSSPQKMDSEAAIADPGVEDFMLPYHQCYDAALAYQRCVETDTLSNHLALAASFEERGAQQRIVHQAAMEAQRFSGRKEEGKN